MKFFIPLYYSFFTRINKITTLISYIYTFLLINFLLVYLVSGIENNMQFKENTLIFILAFISLNIVYEIGYLYNDYYTIKKEKNPTLRLSNEENLFLNDFFPLLVAFRVFLITIIILLLSNFRNINLNLFILMLSLLNLSYALHNYFRNKMNLVTIFLLMFFKYLSIPLLFIKSICVIYILGIFLLTFPLVRTLLFTVHERIGIKLIDKKKIVEFRVKYFFIGSILGLALNIFSNKMIYLFYFSFYFFVFYFSFYILKKLKNNLKR